MVAKWHFVESEKDGELWLKSPKELTACVEFESSDVNGGKTVHRVMVVTRGWLEKHLSGVRESATGPLWAGVPSLLVVPDATGDKLRGFLSRVMEEGGFKEYAVRIE